VECNERRCFCRSSAFAEGANATTGQPNSCDVSIGGIRYREATQWKELPLWFEVFLVDGFSRSIIFDDISNDEWYADLAGVYYRRFNVLNY